MITGVIFDMDGVLVDSTAVWEKVGGWYIERQGITPGEDCNTFLETKSMHAGVEYLRKAYHLPLTSEQIFAGIVEILYEYYAGKFPAKDGALEFLCKLKERGLPVTVATSTDRRLVQAAFDRLGFSAYVDSFFTCGEAGAGKEESPAVYDMARECMGTKKGSTWVFEDSLHGVRTANRAGYKTVGMYDKASEKDQELLKKEATLYFTDLRDFDAVYHQLCEWRGCK